ncbi:MFS transporter [Kineosporia sp. J2-2]|uniref:MFS transporter n=1 Tax=Kineosporia corallincola TaxID=2835133 RepID=A0ABS5TJ60_9ACTN|nr:MFS transporter [Kineosporia corallincola]MBT0770098.1 MFS transporter [Kineosporia corallincola]
MPGRVPVTLAEPAARPSGGKDGRDDENQEEIPLGRNRQFLLMWAGSGAAVLAERFSAAPFTFVVIYEGYAKGLAGLVAFAALLPQLLVQLPAGVLVDRWDRRRVMIVADLVRLAGIGSVALALVLGHVWLWHLAVVAFVQGTFTVFYTLSERGAVRFVVPRKQLPSALARNEARARAAALGGHPAGGALYELTRWAPFACSAALYLFSLISILLLRGPMPPPPHPAGKTRRSPWAEVREGLAWVWRERDLRIALVLVAVSNMIFQGIILALQFIAKDTGRSPVSVSLILAAGGVGGLLGALAGGRWIQRAGMERIMVVTYLVWALVLPGMALTRDAWLLGGLFALMSGIGASVTVAGTVHQMRVTPDRLQGRVGSVVFLMVSGFSAFGALGAGYLLQEAGTRTAMLVFSAVMAGLAAVAALVFGPRAGRRRSRGRHLAGGRHSR